MIEQPHLSFYLLIWRQLLQVMKGFLIALGVLFVLCSTVLFFLQNERRNIILQRFRLRRRRNSGSRTPPRSLSPEKQRARNVSASDYLRTFPPSRRSALAKITFPSTPVQAVAASRPDWTERILPIEESYLEAKNDTYTPCELSVAEIKALGDFPDYATLSGVPLPRPHHHFDIDKALPRPYRPFRWTYHQTMCKIA